MYKEITRSNFLNVISDGNLRANSQNALDHAVYMIYSASTLSKDRIRSNNYKIAIVHIASIVEALLHDALNKRDCSLINTFITGQKYKNIKVLYQPKGDFEIIAGERYHIPFKLTPGTPLKHVIDSAFIWIY